MTRPMIRLGLLAALACGTAQAQPTGQQPEPRPPAPPQLQSTAQPAPCAGPRAWLEAEETTPGILQRMAREALTQCLASAVTQVPVALAPR